MRKAQSNARVGAALGLAAGALGGCWLLLSWASSGTTRTLSNSSAASLDELLAALATAAAWGIWAWLALATSISFAAAFRPRAEPLCGAAAVVAPVSLRRFVALLLGVTLLRGSPVAVAVEAPGYGSSGSSTRSTPVSQPLPDAGAFDRPAPRKGASAVAPSPGVGWAPDRPAAPRKAESDVLSIPPGAPLARPERSAQHEVVVRAGDTLWDIARRHLAPQASTTEIAREWPRWHAANKRTIGSDPHLIHPGQRLRAPLTERTSGPKEIR